MGKQTTDRLVWFIGEGDDDFIWAYSSVWKDEVSPLAYYVRQDLTNDFHWVADFEGSELARGDLLTCLEACQGHDREGDSSTGES